MTEQIQQAEERRQGKTGVWTFVMKTPEGYVLATSALGTNYIFAAKEWGELPLVWLQTWCHERYVSDEYREAFANMLLKGERIPDDLPEGPFEIPMSPSDILLADKIAQIHA